MTHHQPTRPARADQSQIARTLDVLFEPDQVIELRALVSKKQIDAGYFTDREKLIEAARRYNGRAPQYVVANVIDPRLLARYNNRVETYAATTTTDEHIIARRWLPVDFDPDRPAGIPSSDAEHAEAHRRAQDCRDWLASYGWPAPIYADSGNGAWLLYKLPDLDNTPDWTAKIKRCLAIVSLLYQGRQADDGIAVKVDQTIFNAARIVRLFGTDNLKGDGDRASGRMNRASQLVEVPEPVPLLTPAAIERLLVAFPEETADARRPNARSNGAAWDQTRVETFIDQHQIAVAYDSPYDGGYKWVLAECPFNAEHTDKSAVIILRASGMLGFRCHHNGCTGNDWKALRGLLEPDYAERSTVVDISNRRNGLATLPDDEPPHPVDIVLPGHSANSANSANGSAQLAGLGIEPWGPIVAFEGTELPAFPTGVLPPWLRDFAEALAEATQTPLDLAGMLALAVLATCAQRWIMVEPRPGWIEPTNLFLVIALPPASRKSAVFRAFIAPLLAYEQQQAGEAKRRIAEVETLRDILEERLNAAKRDAAKAKGVSAQDAMDRANELTDELSCLQTPTIPRLIVDDVTPEALATLLAEQGGRMAALSPEGDVFAIMAGRYSGTSGPNFSVFLKGHAGDTLRVDRRNRSEFVDWPALTLGITTQPEVVRGLADKAGFRGQGLLGRFLYALPPSLIGHRRIDAPPVPEVVRQNYHASLATILRYRAVYSANSANSANSAKESLIDDSNSIYIYKISTEASILLNEFLGWLEPHLAADAAFGSFADWSGKLAGATLRIAALLHMATVIPSQNSHNSPKEISVATLGDALTIARYLLAHARAAFQEMGSDPAIAHALRALTWIEQHEIREFTKRDLFEGIKRSTSKADDLDPVLKVLCDHGYIRPIEASDRSGPGRRPSQRYEVHPSLSSASQNSHNTQNDPIPAYTFALPDRFAESDINYAAVRQALEQGQEQSVRSQCAAHGFDADAVIARAMEAAV